MGLPKISIAFKTAAVTAIKRGMRGIVALILKDSTNNGYKEVITVDEIPTTLSAANKKQIELALMGTVNPPKKVAIYVLPGAAADYTEAQVYLETVKWDYLAVPAIAEADVTAMAAWIKGLRDAKGRKVKAVLPNCTADHEGIINFATDNIAVGATTYAAKDYCSRIAGVLAGIPLTISATYQVLPEITDVPHMTESDMNTAIDAGKLILMHDGEKVKIARGVNSLITTTADKGEDFKKITIIDKMDMINDDIKHTAEDNYIGKISNSYDHKCLLISAIQGYFDQLELDGILDKGKNTVFIDIPAQTAYLKSIGIDTSAMNEQQIKEANTKDKVFLGASTKPLDAMEDITLNIAV